MRAHCTALGTCLPEGRLTNEELARRVETTDEWITTRTGIRERRIADPQTTCADLAVQAGEACLRHGNCGANELDGIIVATITGDLRMPAVANVVQHRLGAARAWGYDLLNACNGFLAALATATAFIEAGRARRILVIGVDVMSRIVDYRDRNTCILFGDGAGAMLVEAAPGLPGPSHLGVAGFRMHSDGGGGHDLCLPGSGTQPLTDAQTPFVAQNGRIVFSHAVRRMAEVAEACLHDQGLSGEDVDLVVPHQANLRIIEATAERLKVPMERVVVNIGSVGNTTAGTLPLALADAQADGRLRPGSRVLLCAFGGGFAWGACYLRWGRP
jgi:3-oxoacyl-[acyl-carrier-protein] synthase-3